MLDRPLSHPGAARTGQSAFNYGIGLQCSGLFSLPHSGKPAGQADCHLSFHTGTLFGPLFRSAGAGWRFRRLAMGGGTAGLSTPFNFRDRQNPE